MEVSDADFGNDVGEVIGVDHDRFEIKVCILLQSDSVELIDEAREAFFRDGRDHLDDELLAAVAVAHEFVAVRPFFARFFPCRSDMTAAFGIAAHVRSAAEACDIVLGRSGRVAEAVDLHGGADEHISGIVTGSLAEGTV